MARRPTTPLPEPAPKPCPFGLKPLAGHPAVIEAQAAFDQNARELAEAELDQAYARQQAGAVEWGAEAEKTVARLRRQRDELAKANAEANAEALAAMAEQLRPLWAERAQVLLTALQAVQPAHDELGALWGAVRRACGSTPPQARWPVLPPSVFYATETALKQLRESLESRK